MTDFSVIIPARYGSTRLPGKALLDIAGKPMVQHVYERAKQSDAKQIIIATDDQRIVDICEAFGAQVCLTSVNHKSGTDRLQEVAHQLNLAHDDIVVNVQGDEPLIAHENINQAAINLHLNAEASIATLSEKIENLSELLNPNNVKVVSDDKGFALYFSRSPIPWGQKQFSVSNRKEGCAEVEVEASAISQFDYFRHIGIYAYRVAFLHDFVTWPSSKLEVMESLEQLRALSYGKKIHVSVAKEKSGPGIDTEEDLDKVRKAF